ncbi:dihydroxyacetone kinase subunit L [uncultured Anaerococcus sp.]|uniref:dihydroxyacetone kinase subunit L n=1 Tax=uncultured Anaerococcus sp. TaxID=293428 RepID=UPI0026012CAC|nr:dihydroxyacetone kinase subunit L [uncultured Anaerococcus sp.]
MNSKDIHEIIIQIRNLIDNNKSYLVELDQKFGDGDLGVSMSQGFNGILNDYEDNNDLGRLLLDISRNFNESAPSSLGTIISFGIMGMAKSLKDKNEIGSEEFYCALISGVENIEKKAHSKEGEKTIIDSIRPALRKAEPFKSDGFVILSQKLMEGSAEGANSTKDMISKHGRAAYHNEKTLGHIDGGAYVGKLIFEAISNYYGQ